MYNACQVFVEMLVRILIFMFFLLGRLMVLVFLLLLMIILFVYLHCKDFINLKCFRVWLSVSCLSVFLFRPDYESGNDVNATDPGTAILLIFNLDIHMSNCLFLSRNWIVDLRQIHMMQALSWTKERLFMIIPGILTCQLQVNP